MMCRSCERLGSVCPDCERRAEDRAEQRRDGRAMTEADWDAWEAGPGWHYTPGMAGWRS